MVTAAPCFGEPVMRLPDREAAKLGVRTPLQKGLEGTALVKGTVVASRDVEPSMSISRIYDRAANGTGMIRTTSSGTSAACITTSSTASAPLPSPENTISTLALHRICAPARSDIRHRCPCSRR